MGVKTIWKWITGRLRKEREWMEQPRFVPEEYKDIRDGDPSWIFSKEYVDPKRTELRVYLHAVKTDEVWEVRLCLRNMETGKTTFRYEDYGDMDKPKDVVQAFHEFERGKKDDEFIPVPQSKSTYRTFANEHGIYFDKNDTPYMNSETCVAMKEVTVTRKKLDALYNSEAAKKIDVSTWEGLHAFLDSKKPAIADEDIGQDEGWGIFIRQARPALQKLSCLSATLRSGEKVHRVKRKMEVIANQKIELLFEYGLKAFKTDTATSAARYLFDKTCLLGILHAGADFVSEQFSKGIQNIDVPTRATIRAVGEVAAAIAVQKLGVDTQDSEKISNLIMQGPDPRGDTLPIEKMLQRFPVELPTPRRRKPRTGASNTPSA